MSNPGKPQVESCFSNGEWSRQWVRIRVAGPDAEDFLHRLTTIAVKTMPASETRLGFLLTPQGKIRAAFYLHRVDRETFWLELDGGRDQSWSQECLSALEQFHFGEKLSIAQDAQDPTWIFGVQASSGISHGTRDWGIPWSFVWPDQGPVPPGLPALSDEKLEDLRIRAMIPRTDRELTLQSNPLDLGLGAGIAENKGCYPGQEVIEKIIALGEPPKRLALVEGESLRVGQTLTEATQPNSQAGVISSVTADGRQGLAVLRKTAAKAGQPLGHVRVVSVREPLSQ